MSKVQLSSGDTVEVGQLNWSGFKRLKTLIAKTVSGPVLRETVDIVSGPLGGIVSDLLQSISAAIKTGDGSTDAQAAVASQLAEKWGGAQTLSLVMSSLEQLKGSIANILTELLETSDEFSTILIDGSIKDWKTGQIDNLPYPDVMALRDAALLENDLGKLFDLEKNWWGRVMSSGKACLGTPTSKSPGMSTTSTN